MYYKSIELCLKDKASPINDGVKNLFWHFLFALERNGQILKNYKAIQTKNFVFHVTTPKMDSLEEKYDSLYVKRDRKEILNQFTLQVKDYGVDLESQSYCECKKRSAIEMQTFRFDIDSVFTCCDCGKPIALYELPHLEGSEDYCSIQLWQDNYSAMDILWMNCLCDRYTGNQRINPDSALNKQGIELAQSLSEQLGYPVYYHLADDHERKVKFQKVGKEKMHVCPKCSKLMKRVAHSEDYRIDVCDDCKLSYDSR